MKWINSSGGPLLVLQEGLVADWHGNDNSDYDRACSVDDYLGLIDVGPGEGLVLGDEPSQTTWQQLSNRSGVIIRWVFAPDEPAVLRSLADIEANIWDETNLILNVTYPNLLVFDAVCPGNDPDCMGTDCRLLINLEAGKYSIQTAHHQPDKETSLILHRLRKEMA